MKKMTIALLTAAAMGTSGFAVAQSGPNFGGRIDFTYTDLEGESGNASAANSKLSISGDDDAIAGLRTFYYGRIELENNTDDQNIDYAYAGFEGDFGRVSAGIDDDLVYKFVGVRSDVYRGTAPGFNAHYASGNDFGDNPSLQYHLTTGAFTVAAYGDTGATSDDTDGVDHVQFGATADLGMVSLGAVYADRRAIEGYDEELHLGATLDLDVASIRATVGNATDTPETGDTLDTPYHIAAVVPLTDILTATVGYGNNDAANEADEASNVTGMLMANLGGGVDVNVAVRNGDTGDGVSAGLRYTF